MYLRCLVMFVISGTALFGWTLWQESGTRQMPLWQGIVISLVTIMFTLSSALVVALAFTTIVAPFLISRGSPWNDLIFLPGILLGMWSGSLGLQLVTNAARRVLGKPAHKLEFFRQPARKKRKKAAASKPAQH